MVAPIIGGITVGQQEQAKSMIRLLKQYLGETKNDRARRQIALAVKAMADELVEMPNVGQLSLPPRPPPHEFVRGGPFVHPRSEPPPPPPAPPLRKVREGVGVVPPRDE